MNIGVDIGGTHLRVALVDERGTVMQSARERVQAHSPAEVLTQLEGALQRLQLSGETMSLGLGIPALLNSATGMVKLAPNLDWRDVAFGAMAEERLCRTLRLASSVHLVNDVNAIAVGESTCGAARGARDVVCVFVGTGVGMGAICDGRLLAGADGFAAELGHVKVMSPTDPRARLCGCGARGCLEAQVSGRHLPATAEQLEAAANGGDAGALRLWGETAEILGRAIANVITLLNPRVLVLGGGVLMSAPSLRARVAESVRAFAAREHLEKLVVATSVLGDDAGVIGAAMVANKALKAPREPNAPKAFEEAS